MAEKGTKINDQDAGDIVATRDAAENDSVGDSARVIQLVENSESRKAGFAAGTYLRTHDDGSAYEETVDGLDQSTVSTEITDNLLTIGDKTTLLVNVFTSLYASQGTGQHSIVIIPLVFDSSDVLIGMLDPKMPPWYQHKIAPTPCFSSFNGEVFPMASMLAWHVGPFDKVGIYIPYKDAYIEKIKIQAAVVSGPSRGVLAGSDDGYALWRDFDRTDDPGDFHLCGNPLYT